MNISLELMNVKRKTNIKINDGKISMDIYLDIDTALSELPETKINFVSNPQKNKSKRRIRKAYKKPSR